MDFLQGLSARFHANERGAAAIEYAIILGLMVIAIVAALTSMGGATGDALQLTADQYPDA